MVSSARYPCGSDLKQVVLCEKDELKVQICHCMHYEVELNQTVAGNCMFTCYMAISTGSTGTPSKMQPLSIEIYAHTQCYRRVFTM